jgi:Multicopper oxidase
MKASCTILKYRTKRYGALFTSYDINTLTASLFQGTFWYHSHFKNQYCDGLRGAMVIYDENDPHKHLYDIDDGELDL